MEEDTGIPYSQQRVRFLEVSDLRDEQCLYDCGVVPGSVVDIHLWPDWGRESCINCLSILSLHFSL